MKLLKFPFGLTNLIICIYKRYKTGCIFPLTKSNFVDVLYHEKIYIYLLLIVFSCLNLDVSAQSNAIFGFQTKVFFPFGLAATDASVAFQRVNKFTISAPSGYYIGGLVRKNIYKQRIALESGLGLSTKHFSYQVDSGDFSVKHNFTILTYEIPITAFVFIKLTEHSYLSNNFGVMLNFQPSDIYKKNLDLDSTDCYVVRKLFVTPSLNVGTGYEYRTKSDGYFYFGITYNRTFIAADYAKMRILSKYRYSEAALPVNTSYFGFDVRYYFASKKEENDPIEISPLTLLKN